MVMALVLVLRKAHARNSGRCVIWGLDNPKRPTHLWKASDPLVAKMVSRIERVAEWGSGLLVGSFAQSSRHKQNQVQVLLMRSVVGSASGLYTEEVVLRTLRCLEPEPCGEQSLIPTSFAFAAQEVWNSVPDVF